MTLNNQWQCAELVCTQSHANANSAHTPTRMAAAAATKVPQLLVASKSPAKITACREAVQKVLPHIQNVHAFDIPSLVRPQPFDDDETLQGAVNRLQGLAAAWRQQQQPQPKAADYQQPPQHEHDVLAQCSPDSLLLAIEGGVLQRNNSDLYCFAWVAAQLAGGGKISTARSAEFLLPRRLSELVLQGMELGAADDVVFGRTSSGQGSGTVGILTHNLVTRAHYYESTVIMSLIPFINPELYPEHQPLVVEE